jgi:hypothetical protein
MKLTYKVIISAVLVLIFGGLLFLSPLKNNSPSSSPWTMIVMVLDVVSLVFLVVFISKILMKKK